MSCGCGCCAGVEVRTPESVANPPGRAMLHRRVGRHGTFLDSMLARLSRSDRPALAALLTRATDDPAIALLDAGAILLDVLAFYQERIANEGYLRTATERRSMIELARLVGYRPRPGLAASTYLAFTVEQGHRLSIPEGTKAQSVPGQGELPQTFETSDALEARAEWSQISPRRTAPQLTPTPDQTSGIAGALSLYLKGTSTGLKPNDAILIVASPAVPYRVVSVEPDPVAVRTRVVVRPWPVPPLRTTVTAILQAVESGAPTTLGHRGNDVMDLIKKLKGVTDDEKVDEETLLGGIDDILPKLRGVREALRSNATILLPWVTGAIAAFEEAGNAYRLTKTAVHSAPSPAFDFSTAAERAVKAPSFGPRGAAHLSRSLGNGLAHRAGGSLAVVSSLEPELGRRLPALLSGAKGSSPATLEVYALRVRAQLFGHNAPQKLVGMKEGNVPDFKEHSASDMREVEDETAVALDARYDAIVPDSWAVIDTSGVAELTLEERDPKPAQFPVLTTRISSVGSSGSRSAYGLNGPSTRLVIGDNKEGPYWIVFPGSLVRTSDDAFGIIRKTVVHAGSERLELAEAPIEDPICDGVEKRLELAGLYLDLEPGRWLIVAGERTDIPGVTGVEGAERVMIAAVEHDVARHEDKTPRASEVIHTFVTLASPLSYCYRRDTATIYANVVHATHGETRKETLGAGNGAEAFQRFTLKASPLTFTAAPTAEGAATSLEVRVNDVRWHERSTLAGSAPTDRIYVTTADDDAKTTVGCGDGRNGARIPTGRDNVKAVYRTGIGRPGNLAEKRITLLGSRPLGLKEVINPLPASGGADAESRDQLRRNIPVALQALDRLVSVRDYQDFARAFAGIGKAQAVRRSDGRRELVHVTIAGQDDIPILETSDLYLNLSAAFQRLGHARVGVELAVRERILLVAAAGVRIDADHDWEFVEPRIRAALLDTFGFDRREFGQWAHASEVLAAIQGVPGVTYADVSAFGGVPERVEEKDPTPRRRLITPTEVADQVKKILDPDPASNVEPSNSPLVRAATAQPGAGGIAPAQLAILSPEVPETLVLTLLS